MQFPSPYGSNVATPYMTQRSPHKRISLLQLMHHPWRDVPATVALVLANILVFGMMAATSGDAVHLAPGLSLQWGANFGPATQEGEWWRLFTAMFVHLSGVHIAINVWALWDIGRLVESLLGRWRYVALYVGSGVVGNVLSLALQDHQRVSSGASGAIFGLYGALLVFLWRERTRLAPDEYRWVGVVAMGFSVIMLGMGFFVPSIDNAAHGGGLLGGMVLSMLLGHAAPGLDSPRASKLIPLIGLLLVMVVVAGFMGLSRPPYRYADEMQTRAAMQQFAHEDERIRARWKGLMQSDNTQSFEQMANAMQTEVIEPYQRSFEALASVDGMYQVPSHAALLQLQSYAQLRQADALRAVKALQAVDPALPTSP